MGTHHGAVEELNDMRRPAGLRQELKKCLEHTRAAEPPEPLPDAVPIAELRRQCPPRYAVYREVMQCFQELPIIVSGFAPFRLCGVEHLQHDLPICFRHLRQHGRPPMPVLHESKKARFGNPYPALSAIRPQGLAFASVTRRPKKAWPKFDAT